MSVGDGNEDESGTGHARFCCIGRQKHLDMCTPNLLVHLYSTWKLLLRDIPRAIVEVTCFLDSILYRLHCLYM